MFIGKKKENIMKVNLMTVLKTETEQEKFVEIWKDKDYYMDDAENPECFCAPWSWCNVEIEVPENYTLEELVTAYWYQYAKDEINELLKQENQERIEQWCNEVVERLKPVLNDFELDIMDTCYQTKIVDENTWKNLTTSPHIFSTHIIIKAATAYLILDNADIFAEYELDGIKKVFENCDAVDWFDYYQFVEDVKKNCTKVLY